MRNLLGLRLLLYVNASDYLPTTEAVGVRITIHDKEEYPFPVSTYRQLQRKISSTSLFMSSFCTMQIYKIFFLAYYLFEFVEILLFE